MKTLTLIVVAAVVVGCSHSNEMRMAPGVHLITVRGNGFASMGRVQSEAQDKAERACREEGFPRYVFVDAETSASSEQTPSAYRTHIVTIGNRATAVTTETPGIRVTRHGLQVKAVCVTEEEWERNQSGMRERLLSQ